MVSKFHRLVRVTLIALYVLILIGGLVRATGSGMGCPDWPKCFGLWVPPTHVSELPANYPQLFGEKLKGEVEFNVYKTWTEYLNRLAGVLLGIFILVTAVSAYIKHRNGDRRIWISALLGLIMVIFQGWLGSKVVSNELLPLMVTLHMFVAILMVFVYVYLYVLSSQLENRPFAEVSASSHFLLSLLIILSSIQILVGTQVREVIDHLNLYTQIPKIEWTQHLGTWFNGHVVLAFAVVALTLWFARNQKREQAKLDRASQWLVILVFAEIVTGGTLYFFDILSAAQPLHLTFSTVMLGTQTALWVQHVLRK